MQQPQAATLTTPLADLENGAPPPRHINSVDATTGQPIVARILLRKRELVAFLAGLPDGDLGMRNDVGIALAIIDDLLTGDLGNVPSVVAVDMNRWLERNKHLGERATTVAATPIGDTP